MVKQRGRSRSYWSDSAGAVFESSSAKISTGRQSVSVTRENGRSSRPRMSMPTRSRMRILSPVQPLRKILGSVPYFPPGAKNAPHFSCTGAERDHFPDVISATFSLTKGLSSFSSFFRIAASRNCGCFFIVSATYRCAHHSGRSAK